MLSNLKRVFVQFKTGDPTATSAREFLQRVTGANAKKSNPSCEVNMNVLENGLAGEAFVELEFVDKDTRRILTADLKVEEILMQVQDKGGEMILQGLMKEVNYDPWKKENRLKDKF